MKKVWLVAVFAVIGSCVVIAMSLSVYAKMKAAALPFSADVEFYTEGELEGDIWRIYATPEAVRIETGRGKDEVGVSFTTIYDLQKMVGYVLEDWHQKYFPFIIPQHRRGDDLGAWGVPCETRFSLATPLGSDTLRGRETEKWRCTDESENCFMQCSMIVWFDTRLQRTIRYEYEDEDHYMEMTNIKEGPQPESLFAVPPDYSR